MAKRKSLKESVLTVVQEVHTEQGTSFRCQANPDEKCTYEQKKFNAGNFKRHLLSQHTVVAKSLGFVDEGELGEEPPEKKARCGSANSKLLVDSNKTKVILGTLQLVASHSLPQRFPEWEGSKTLLQPLFQAAGISFSRSYVTGLIAKGASVMQKLISERANGRVLNLKIDSASRRGRHVFAINAQCMNQNENVEIIHLATHEMIERQTAINIKNVMEEELAKFGIDKKQILAITSDNGINLLTAVRELKNILVSEKHDIGVRLGSVIPDQLAMLAEIPEDESSDNEGMDDGDDNIEDGLINCEEDEELDDFGETESNPESDATASSSMSRDENDDDEVELLESIRCGAHTAQLAVWDVIKHYKRRLGNLNKKCIKMRHIAHRKLFVLNKIPLPPKVNETRWNMWFILLKYLQSIKESELLSMLKNQDKDFSFSRHWTFIDQFCRAFEPMFNLTIKLQKTHVALSQFYTEWLVCQAHLNAISGSGNKLAKKLLSAMQTRIIKLSNNSAFKACLYIDPRYNFLGSGRLSADDKNEAQKYLLSLNKRLDDVAGVTEPQDKMSENGDVGQTSNFVENYLADLFNEDSVSSLDDSNSGDSLLVEIVKLEARPKVSICGSTVQRDVNTPGSSTMSSEPFDIMVYWKQRRHMNPRIYRLAREILSIPSTQVTVERLFSQLKFVMQDNRMRLSDQSVKDLMLLKMNQDLLPTIAEIIAGER